MSILCLDDHVTIVLFFRDIRDLSSYCVSTPWMYMCAEPQALDRTN